MAHVSRERLYEIAQIDGLSKQPEWPPIRKCAFCSNELLAFVRDHIQTQNERLDSLKVMLRKMARPDSGNKS